jgi:hypothetical protein
MLIRKLHASSSPDVMSLGAKWVGELSGPLGMALANRVPALNPADVVRDAFKRVMDRRRARDAIAGPGPEEDPDPEVADGKRGRMSSGKRFTGDGFGTRFLDQAARATRTSIQAINEANRKYRAARSNTVTHDAPRPSTSVAAPPKTGSMRDWISRMNTANREYTARKREQERTHLSAGGGR